MQCTVVHNSIGHFFNEITLKETTFLIKDLRRTSHSKKLRSAVRCSKIKGVLSNRLMKKNFSKKRPQPRSLFLE